MPRQFPSAAYLQRTRSRCLASELSFSGAYPRATPKKPERHSVLAPQHLPLRRQHFRLHGVPVSGGSVRPPRMYSMMAAYELDRRVRKSGKHITVNSWSPGVVPTTQAGRDMNLITKTSGSRLRTLHRVDCF